MTTREKAISGLSVTGVQKENKGPATTHFLETMKAFYSEIWHTLFCIVNLLELLLLNCLRKIHY